MYLWTSNLLFKQLHREFLAALSPSAGKYVPAGFSFHSFQKPMTGLSALHFWLIGSLHNNVILMTRISIRIIQMAEACEFGGFLETLPIRGIRIQFVDSDYI